MDHGIGRIIEQLRVDGTLDNTLIVYASDNGGVYSSPAPNNGVFKGGKMMIYEGGRRVPMIVHYPRLITQQRTYDGLVSFLDVMPTILDITGSGRASAEVDGVSLTPVIKGSSDPIHQDVLCWASNTSVLDDEWQKRELAWKKVNDSLPKKERQWNYWFHPAGWAAHKDHWKLTQIDAGPIELFDLKADPGETRDVSAQHPEIARELMDAYGIWISSMPPPLAWDRQKWKDFFPKVIKGDSSHE